MPLDGMEETWWVKVAEKVYGPYTRTQMARFVAEGRVTGSSLVSLNNDGGWTPARHSPALQGALNEGRPSFRAETTPDAAQTANIIVFAELSSTSSRRFEYELRRMGAVAEIVPGLWMVRTRQTAGVIRNALSQMLERNDKLMVVDATRDRLAWFNIGPETESRMREVWNADTPESVR